MNPLLRLTLIIGVLVYFILIIKFLKKKALNLKYTLLWFVSGIIMLFIVIFPDIADKLSTLLGFATPVNAVFAVEMFFILTILMSITSIVSKLNEKNKKLIQQSALFEKRLRELELMKLEKQSDGEGA